MSIEEAIINRRAYYPLQFSGDKIAEEHISKMLELANWAPTHKHTEPWRFHIYQDEALNSFTDKLCEFYIKHTPSSEFNQAKVNKMQDRKELLSHIIVIIMERHEESGLPEYEEIASTAMAVQNMWLYTAGLKNIGGYWSSPAFIHYKGFDELLKLGPTQRCLGFFNIGVLSDDAAKAVGKRGDWKEKVKWYKN